MVVIASESTLGRIFTTSETVAMQFQCRTAASSVDSDFAKRALGILIVRQLAIAVNANIGTQRDNHLPFFLVAQVVVS